MRIFAHAQLLIVCCLFTSFAFSAHDEFMAQYRKTQRILKKCEALLAARPPRLPKRWAEYVRLDQQFNIPVRGNGPLPKKDRKIVPIFYFEIKVPYPFDNRTWHDQEKLRGEVFMHPMFEKVLRDQEFIKVNADQKTATVRFFFRYSKASKGDSFIQDAKGNEINSDAELFEKLISEFGEPKTIFWGTRIQGHMSYFVFDPTHPNRSPFTLKFQTSGIVADSGYGSRYNAQASGDSKEIFATETILQSNKGSFITDTGQLYPEPLAMLVRARFTEISYSLRLLEGAWMHPKLQDAQPLPVHGLFGNQKKLEELATLQKVSVREWTEAYIKKLSRFLAEQQGMLGMIHEAHTQNLIVYVSEEGEVVGFGQRDITDGHIDNWTHYFWDRETLKLDIADNQVRFSPMHQMNVPYSQDSRSRYDRGLHKVGTFMAEYTLQSFAGITSDHKEAERFAGLFLFSFFDELQKITGLRIELPKQIQVWIADALNSKLKIKSYNQLKSGVALAIETFYQKFNLARALKSPITQDMILQDQKQAQSIWSVSKGLYAGEAAWLDPNAFFTVAPYLDLPYQYRSELIEAGLIADLPYKVKSREWPFLFAFNGKGLFIFDPKEGHLLGYADIHPQLIEKATQALKKPVLVAPASKME